METLPFSIIGGETTRGGNGLGAKQLRVKNRDETFWGKRLRGKRLGAKRPVTI